MGEAFWKPRMIPVLPCSLAAWMSAVSFTCRMSSRSRKRRIHTARWAMVWAKFSHVATVALMAVTSPARSPSKTASLSQLLTFRPSMTTASS